MDPLHCQRGCKPVQPLWKPVRSFLEKLKAELSYNPVIPLLGPSLFRNKINISKRYLHPMFTAVLLTTAKSLEQPKCPSVAERIIFNVIYKSARVCVSLHIHTNT